MKQKKAISTSYDFFIQTDTSRYKGEWIAIAKNRIVAHGQDAEDVYRKAVKKTGNKDISLAKVPDEQMLILRISSLW